MLRDWCTVAYQRELGAELVKLRDSFHQWETGVLDEFALRDAIQTFHEGQARELNARYGALKDDFLVAAAIARGVIEKTELTSELLDAITPMLSKLEEPSNEGE